MYSSKNYLKLLRVIGREFFVVPQYLLKFAKVLAELLNSMQVNRRVKRLDETA